MPIPTCDTRLRARNVCLLCLTRAHTHTHASANTKTMVISPLSGSHQAWLASADAMVILDCVIAGAPGSQDHA
eukprot:1159338-Pelagomonas_calceolata.AAC.23